jgi:Immunity protein 32
MLLTVERNSQQQAVEIHFDPAGLEFLIKRLEALKANGGHDHLMSSSWAGTELSEEKQGVDNEIVHHLSLHLWP